MCHLRSVSDSALTERRSVSPTCFCTRSTFSGTWCEIGEYQFARLVGTGDNVMIGGFIVEATARFLTRGLGPTLAAPPFNVPGTLADPTLELHNGNGDLLASDDDWQTDGQANQIPANWKPPHAKESALLRTLAPGNYTAILSGKNNTTGVALVEVYNLDAP